MAKAREQHQATGAYVDAAGTGDRGSAVELERVVEPREDAKLPADVETG